MPPTRYADCDHCARAIDHLEIDANVSLHEHLAGSPGCQAAFDHRIEGWGAHTWLSTMSGAA